MIPIPPPPPPARTNFVLKDPFLHPKMAAAIDDALLAIERPNVPVVMIVGPTGVGKTFIRQQLTGSICAPHRPTGRYRPAVGFEVQKFSDNRTHWGALNMDLLHALGSNKKSNMNPAARILIAKAIRRRKNEVIFLDEAQHLVPKQTSKTEPAENGNVIKSLVQHIPAKLVLLGTYRLNPLTRTNDEMARRVKRIHISRYRPDSAADQEVFRQLLAWIDYNSRASLGVILAAQPDFIYSGCCGLMGILADWLNDAFVVSRKMGSAVITQAALTRTRKDKADIDIIEAKTKAGEKYFEDIRPESDFDAPAD